MASPPQGPVDPAGPRENSPAAVATGTPVCRRSPVSHHASDEGETSPDTSIPDRIPRGDVLEEEIEVPIVVAIQMIATPQLRGVRRKMGSRVKFRSLNSEARKDTLKM